MVNKKSKLIALVAVIVAGVILVGLTLVASSDKTEEKNTEQANLADYLDPTTGLKFSYATNLQLKANQTPVSGVLANLTKSDPRIQVTVWQEEDSSLESIKKTGQELHKALLTSVATQVNELKRVYPKGVIIDTSFGQTNGFDSAEITFSYLSDNLDTTQRRLIILKDNNTAVNIAAQTLTESYESVNKDYFQTIVSSAKF